MLLGPTQLLDILIGATALASAWFWWAASQSRLRRVSRDEELDAADLNRLITVMNRNQILNARGALAIAIGSALAALRMIADLFGG